MADYPWGITDFVVFCMVVGLVWLAVLTRRPEGGE